MNILMRTQADPFGFFVGHAGEPIPLDWFAREVNATPREVRTAIADLEKNGVFSRDAQGRIYSRRLVAERARLEQARLNGQQGGNPVLLPDNQRQHDSGYPKSGQNAYPDADKAHGSRPYSRNQNTDSLRSSALEFVEWPTENGRLRDLALIFLAAFGNCFDPVKAQKHVTAYMQVLAQMRSRGVTIESAWSACVNALDANGEKPLFSAAIRMAMSFLPVSPARREPVKAAAGAEISESTRSFLDEIRAEDEARENGAA